MFRGKGSNREVTVMKKALKILSVFLSISLLFCACGKQTEKSADAPSESSTASGDTPSQTNGNVRLPYNTADGINPFFAKSYENLYLTRLLYMPLFTVSSSYDAEPLVASSISISGKTASVSVKSGLKCHGSGNITPSDVVYSFNKAKTSYAFADSLKSVESAAVSGNSVVFTSAFEDAFVALKLVFPIVKENTAELQTDVPIGSGQYYFYENKLVSTADESKSVVLTSVNTSDSSLNAYKIGNTDVYFTDLADCNYTGFYGNYTSADLNNMVYLGFNEKIGGLNKNIRSAIAVLINSDDIAKVCYQGHAIPSKAPCNPNWSVYKALTEGKLGLSGDRQKAAQIIDRCGYTRFAGKALTNGKDVLSYSLIVNADNKYRVAAAYAVADVLNQAGFYIEVKPLSFEDYSGRIASGDYDIYIGEIKLDYSMDLSQLFIKTQEETEEAEKTEPSKVSQSYFEMRAGKISYADFYKVFVEYHPFVPLVFRTGAVFSSNNFSGVFSHFPYDLYYEGNYELFS